MQYQQTPSSPCVSRGFGFREKKIFPQIGRDFPQIGRDFPQTGRDFPKIGRDFLRAAAGRFSCDYSSLALIYQGLDGIPPNWTGFPQIGRDSPKLDEKGRVTLCRPPVLLMLVVAPVLSVLPCVCLFGLAVSLSLLWLSLSCPP